MSPTSPLGFMVKRSACLVQVRRVKSAHGNHLLNVDQGHKVLTNIQHPLRAKRLEHPVDVDRAQAKRVGKLGLGHRELELLVSDKSDGEQTLPQLRHEMSESR